MMINVLYLAWIFVNECVVVEACTVSQFKCSNGACIDIGLRCNDHFDCGDMSDELSCDAVIVCPEGLYRCNDGQCVNTDARCNCVIECNDGTDEYNCVICSISTPLTSVEDLTSVHATSIIATASIATSSTSLEINSPFDQFSTERLDSKIWTSSNLQNEMTKVFKSSLIQTEALHTLKTNIESDKGYIYSSVDMPLSIQSTFWFDLQTSPSYFMSEIYKTSSPLHSTFLKESTFLSPYSTYSLYDSLSSVAEHSGLTPVLSTAKPPSLTIRSMINSAYDITITSTLSDGFEIFPTSLPDVIPLSVTYTSTALQPEIHTSTITTDTSFDTQKFTAVLSIKEELKTSSPNLEISTQTIHSLYESVVTDSISSASLTTSSTVLSTPQNAVIPDDKNDNDYIIPVTLAVCLVLAIVLCITLWTYRERLRDDWLNLENEVRSKIHNVVPCDVHLANPLHPLNIDMVDAICTSLYLDAACLDVSSYAKAMRNVTSLLKPGGKLVLMGVLNNQLYAVGHAKFYCLSLQMDDVISSMNVAELTVLEKFHNGSFNEDDSESYKGPIVIQAEKNT